MPRLNEGEIAPGIALKQAKSREIVKKIITILQKNLMESRKISDKILKVFGSYRKLAAWSDAGSKITPIAENTLRKYLDELYPGGINAFEQARKKLLKKANTTLACAGNKASYKKSGEKLKEENQILINHILQFSAQYLDLLEKTSNMAKAHIFLQNHLKAHCNAYPNAPHGLRIISGNKNE